MSQSNKIRLIAPTMTHDTSGPLEVESDWNPTKIAKVLASLLVAGFREGSIADSDLSNIIDELDGVGEALGAKLNLDARYTESTSEAARKIPGILGLLYISNITQGLAFGKMTRDPAVALALYQTWAEAHVELTSQDQLDTNATARLLELTGSNDEGEYPEELVAEYVENFNEAGCVCGKEHPRAGQLTKATVQDLSGEALLETIPEEVRPLLGMLSLTTGKSEIEITEALRDAFLAGEDPGVAMQRLVVESLGGKVTKTSAPKARVTDVGTVEVDTTQDVVEQLYQQTVQNMPGLRPDQYQAIRDQLEEQRAEIVAAGRTGGVHALRVKLPK